LTNNRFLPVARMNVLVNRLRAVVTGANRGLGAAIARHLLAEHAAVVVLCVRTQDDARPARAILREAGGSGSVVRLDYADPRSIVASARQCSDTLDRVDLLVHCGAVNHCPWRDREESKGPLERLSTEALIDMFAVNVAGPVFASKCFLPLLTRSPKPVLVHTSTSRASLSSANDEQSFGYSVTKAALNMATRKLAPHLRDFAGTVFSVDPGWLATRMGGFDAPGDPADAARAIVKLALSGRADLNGAFVDVNGAHLSW
jgi:NAD(P)-dependent dehydrogenase (short-subunit alcohol dehydrogenase family)